LRPLLAESNPAPEILLHLRDLDLSRPRDGLAAYLLAKQMQKPGCLAGMRAFAASALRRELPGPRFVQEALRMRGIAAWHVGDDAAARAAFTGAGQERAAGPRSGGRSLARSAPLSAYGLALCHLRWPALHHFDFHGLAREELLVAGGPDAADAHLEEERSPASGW